MGYVNFIAYLRHQAEVFFASINGAPALTLLVNTHMSNNINTQLIGFKKDILKKSIDLYKSISYDGKSFN